MKIEKNDTIALLGQMNVQITDAGIARIDTDWIMDPLPSNFSRIYFIADGEAWIRYNNKLLRLLPNHAYLIPCGLDFQYGCDNFMDKVYFHISVLMQDRFDLFNQLTECYGIPLEPGYVKDLANHYRAKDLFHVQQAIYGALARFIDKIGVQSRLWSSYSPQILAAFEYINDNLSAKLTVKNVAEYLMVSDSNLSKHFRNEVGCSTSKYIDMLVLQRAKNLLMLTDLSIGQIAEQLQFCDRFYFARFFHKQTGETPSLFRQRYVGKT